MNEFLASDSIYKNLANTTTMWEGTDSLSNFENNQFDPQMNIWTKDNVSYTFNEHGFRSDPFDNSGEGVAFFGCSNTFGTGIAYKQTHAYIIAKAMGWKCWNFGQSGGANDTIFRLVHHWVPLLKPKFVVILFTHPQRVELIRLKYSLTLTPSAVPGDYKHFYDTWLVNDTNFKMNEIKNKYATEEILKRYNVGYFLETFWHVDSLGSRYHIFQHLCKQANVEDNVARDLLHPGPIANRVFAEHVLNNIPKEYWRH